MSWLKAFLAGEVEADTSAEAELASCEQDIAELCDEVRRQQGIDSDQATQMNLLRGEMGELKLYLAAVIRLLVAKGLATREEFARLVEVVDRSDGVEDGQFGGDIARRDTWTGEEKGEE